MPWFVVIVVVLLAMGGVAASAAENSSDPFYQVLPSHVGRPYVTNPPPLTSLNGILGSKPEFDYLELYVRSFTQLTFETDDPGRRLRHPWILKWAEPLRINIIGDVEPRHKVLLAQVVNDLADITGLPFEIVREYENFLITIDGDPLKDREPSDYGFCFVKIDSEFIGRDGLLHRVEMSASPLYDDAEILECLYEDVSQALGLLNDLAATSESMYRSHAENTIWPSPTWHDVIMLRTLYDPRIKPGMHESEAMPLVREIIAELLDELNATAE